MGAALNLATGYTEVDPNSRITLTTVTAAGAALTRNESAYVYKDYGSAYFGDFIHDIDVPSPTTIANGSKLVVWGVTNTIGSTDGWAAGCYLILNASSTTQNAFTLGEIGGSTSVGGTFTKAASYWRIERNGTSLTAKRATSAANRFAGTWAETLSLTVGTTTYQYHYAMSTWNDATATAITGSTQNVNGSYLSTGTPFTTEYMISGATSGNWNDGDTWGNAGSVKGTDYPGTAGDVVTIAAGDTVTYNVSEANELGHVYIYGKLSFSYTMSTKLVLTAAKYIYIYAAGELEVGTVANPIGSAYTAEVLIAPTADANSGFSITAGGKLTVNGYDFINGTLYTRLQAAWSSGQTFTVVGDVTGVWSTGNYLIVNKYSAAGNVANELYEYTIASMSLVSGNTEITINEAAPGITFREGGIVVNVHRNVTIGKSGWSRSNNAYQSNRPVMTDSNTADGNIILNHCQIVGLYACSTTDIADSDGVVMRNTRYAWTPESIRRPYPTHTRWTWLYVSGINYTIQRNIWVSCVGLGGGATHLVSSYDQVYYDCVFVFQNAYYNSGGSGGSNQYWRCSFVGCYTQYGIGYNGNEENSRFYSCFFGKISGATNNSTMGIDAHVTGNNNLVFKDCYWAGGGDPNLAARNNASGYQGSHIRSVDHNNTAGDNRIYEEHSNIQSETSVLRGGGSGASIKVTPLSNTSVLNVIPVFEWWEYGVTSGSKTRSIYVRGFGWSAFPTANELYFIASEFYENAGDCEIAEPVISTEVLVDNTTWTKLSVTINPGKTTNVKYMLYLGKYTASAGIYVDMQLLDS